MNCKKIFYALSVTTLSTLSARESPARLVTAYIALTTNKAQGAMVSSLTTDLLSSHTHQDKNLFLKQQGKWTINLSRKKTLKIFLENNSQVALLSPISVLIYGNI